MKWKYIILLLSLSIGSLLGMMTYYGFDFKNLADITFYENLANPSIRIIKVQEGLRKEEIADVMGDKLGWSEKERKQFINAHLALNIGNMEGQYFPKSYMILRNEDPVSVGKTMLGEFKKETSVIKKPKSKTIVNEDTALKIASIIQREAAGKSDMKLISGIIWNRIWSGMKLQMDATLQYAKGNEEDGWWEQVNPKDKKINSPYNTYMHNSLPPFPIANPGLAAINAAYNPQKTSCMFYLHDKNGRIHCSRTYDEHKKNIARYY